MIDNTPNNGAEKSLRNTCLFQGLAADMDDRLFDRTGTIGSEVEATQLVKEPKVTYVPYGDSP